MHPDDIKHGYIYAVFSGNDLLNSLEPYIAVESTYGIRFVHANMFELDTSTDGPHRIPVEIGIWAHSSGWVLDPDDIWSFWSERDSFENMFAENEDGEELDHPIVLEAEKILMENERPDGRASTWLRHSKRWRGSSMSAIYDENEQLAGSYVTIFTENPYKLRALLRWLGLPHPLVDDVTRIDRLGRQIQKGEPEV